MKQIKYGDGIALKILAADRMGLKLADLLERRARAADRRDPCDGL